MSAFFWNCQALSYWLHRGWHKFNGYKSFRVRYPDSSHLESAISIRVTHSVARDYREMFGGKIEFDPA